MRILLIEERQSCAVVIASALRDAGFVVDHVRTLSGADDSVAVVRYDAIISDRMLPDGNGLDWIRAQRFGGNTVPILIMTAEQASVDQRVDGLNAGADDYLLRPVPADELVARLRAVLRRSTAALNTVLRVGNVAFDTVSREVRVAGRPLSLPRRETCILELLIRRAGRTVTKRGLEDGLYSFTTDVSSNAIEVGIYRLRGHLAGSGATARVRTVRGAGYAFEEAPAAALSADAEGARAISIPHSIMMVAQVATVLASRTGSGDTALPAMVGPDAKMRVAIVAAALAATMARAEAHI